MKFLFVTWKNDAGALAWQVHKEGHDVRLYIDYTSCADGYDGFIKKVGKPWSARVDWADVIVFDEIGFGAAAEMLRKAGKRVIGGTPYSDKLEWQRSFGQKEMERLGMPILPHREFSSFKTAIDFLAAHPGRYVFKPNGVVASADHSLLFVGQDERGADVVDLLRFNQKKWRHKIKRFMLQEYVAGIEVAIGGFFNGRQFLSPVCVNQEFKRLFPGDIGPLTNDMGSLTYWTRPNRFFDMTLKKIAPALAACRYVGYFDINCIVNAKGVFPLECTSRFGYPTIDTQLSGLKMPVGRFLADLAAGKTFTIPLKDKLQLGVCVVLPPFIHERPEIVAAYKNLAIFYGKQGWDVPGLYFKDIKWDDGQLRVAGESKFIAVSAASGRSPAAIRTQVYGNIEHIKVPNMLYRSDIGERWGRDLASLRAWKYVS